jgi:hypothetical protein
MWVKAHAMALYILNITPRTGTKSISPQHAWTKRKPGISSLRMFGNPVSPLNQQRQRSDGELRGYLDIYLGPSDMARKGHVITSRNGKGYVTSNDILHGEDFQWVTHDEGLFTLTNRSPGTCRNDEDIRAIEHINAPLLLREVYRD